jgi:hypothetical protein
MPLKVLAVAGLLAVGVAAYHDDGDGSCCQRKNAAAPATTILTSDVTGTRPVGHDHRAMHPEIANVPSDGTLIAADHRRPPSAVVSTRDDRHIPRPGGDGTR